MNKTDILNFIQTSPKPVTKREVSDAFRVQGTDARIELKKILKELEHDGAIAKNPGGAYGRPEGLAEVIVIQISDIDIDGDVFAEPVDWKGDGNPPRIEVMPDNKGHPVLNTGDRALARLEQISKNKYEARIIRRFDSETGRIMGMVKANKHGGLLIPTDKKAKHEYEIAYADLNGAKDNDIVSAEILPGRGTRKKARVAEILGRRDDPRAISLISLAEAGLRERFPDKAIKETEGMGVPDTKGREDLRDIPLVTIDGIDARDFDDAVFAEKSDEGYHLIVAIADVAYYVRSSSALDNEAQRRGNSTYFPDRVIPMLPEALSNELCSLKPNVPRACLAVHMWIDGNGKLLRHKFVRGLMRSAARLVYEQVQAAYDGVVDDITKPLLDPVIKPLYEAFRILDAARRERGALELDLPERQVLIDAKGNMTGVKMRTRVDAHKLIEEFMILANVAAAMALEDRRAPCVYRIHDRPSAEKLESAREFVETFGLSLPKGQVTQPRQINQILLKAKELPYSHLISTVILRTQAQAVYSPENIGHFGLALTKYAHFTSPIRRYADLLVHRSLIRAYGLGPGGLDDGEAVKLEQICQNISDCERASMTAERNAIDRFAAAYLSKRLGAEFEGTITGVTRFGLFVALKENGADGIVPMRSLPQDFYVHDEKAHALVGKRSGRVFRLGAPVTVMLMEADGLTGSTVLHLVGHERGADIPGVQFKRSQTYEPGRRDRENANKNKKKYGKKGFKKGPKHRR
ncbi:MAG: ribonuclease R [Alphaproteobacteria bacterium]